MKCEDINTNMLDLIEGRLNTEADSSMRKHISECKNCKAQTQFFEGVMAQIDIEKEIKGSEDFTRMLLDKVGNKGKSRTISMSLFTSAAAAAIIVFGILTGVFLSQVSGGSGSDVYSDLPEEFYYSNEIHLETIEGFFLSNDE